GQTPYFEFAQRGNPQMLRIRWQGMRDPRLGLRRQGLIFSTVIPGRVEDANPESRDSGSTPYGVSRNDVVERERASVVEVARLSCNTNSSRLNHSCNS